MKKLLLVSVLLSSLSLFATEQHQETEFITGSGFDIIKTGDAMSGTINGEQLIADKNCGNHIIGTLGQNQFSVKTLNGKLQGQFGNTTVVFAGIDKNNSAIIVKIGEEFIPVFYTSEGFADGHFQGITFNFELNGHDFSIHLDGEACMGSMMYYTIFMVGVETLSL